jgi:hypothetical protein
VAPKSRKAKRGRLPLVYFWNIVLAALSAESRLTLMMCRTRSMGSRRAWVTRRSRGVMNWLRT